MHNMCFHSSIAHLPISISSQRHRRVSTPTSVYRIHTGDTSLESGSTFCSQCRQLPDFFPRLPLGPPLLPCLSWKVIDEKPFPYFSLADSTRLFSTDVPCEDFSRRDGFLFKPSNEASTLWKLCRADCSRSSGPD